MSRLSHRLPAAGRLGDFLRPALWRAVVGSICCLAVSPLGTTLLCAAGPPSPDCSRVPDESSVQNLLKKKNYDELESLASRSRDCKVETSDGLRALEAFYNRVANLELEAPESRHKTLIRRVKKWKKARPESPTPRVALAKAYRTYAWNAHGGGTASTVSEQGWKLYYERIAMALVELGEGVERDPQAYVELMEAAKAGFIPKGTEPRDAAYSVFLKGIEVDPDYYPLYYEMSTQLLPRWSGEPGEWQAFARESSHKRGGLAGRVLYSRILLEKSHWFWRWDSLRKIDLSWGELKTILDSIEEQRPGSAVEKNLYCYFAMLALDIETASKLFDWIEQDSPDGERQSARKVAWIWEDGSGNDKFDYYLRTARTKRQAVFEMNMEPLVEAEGKLTFTVTVRGPDGSLKPELGDETWMGVEFFPYAEFVPKHVRLVKIPNDYPPGRYVVTIVVTNSSTGTEKTWTQEVGEEASTP